MVRIYILLNCQQQHEHFIMIFCNIMEYFRKLTYILSLIGCTKHEKYRFVDELNCFTELVYLFCKRNLNSNQIKDIAVQFCKALPMLQHL